MLIMAPPNYWLLLNSSLLLIPAYRTIESTDQKPYIDPPSTQESSWKLQLSQVSLLPSS